MKRVVVAVLTMVIVILLLSVLLYAGDDKSVKKETPKNPQVQTQKPCQDKHAQGVCAGHGSIKCTLEKGSTACKDKHAKGECKDNCTLEKGSAACKDKHAKGECKDHDPDKCSAECKEKCAGQDKPPK